MRKISSLSIIIQVLFLVLVVKSSSSFTNNNKTLSKSSNITKGHMSGSSNESQESKRLIKAQAGKIEELKQKEAALARLLASVRMEKLDALRSRPLNIGIIGFGRFGQFIARTFAKHGRVVATSRSDYTDLASGMGITYIPLSNPQQFLEEDLDVIVLATSIVSFEDTVADLAPHLQDYIQKSGTGRGPLIVDVLSVKEHPRQILLDRLPKECDILCTHPMFGPDSGKNGWHGLNFVYEITRIDGVVLEQNDIKASSEQGESFVEEGGRVHSVHELSESHIEGKDRIERFLSIWEEEGCKMVPLSCKAHDAYAADSQFITHLMGRILGAQGLAPTPIDTKGFDSVLKLIDSTTADSFDLFYGLYKYNQNSMDTIIKLRDSMDDVVQKLKEMERNDK
jgi:prephenate dehydrogenase